MDSVAQPAPVRKTVLTSNSSSEIVPWIPSFKRSADLDSIHNKDNEAATLAVSATGVDTGTDIAAVATYQRLRVEISAAGLMTCFADKVEIASIASAAALDQEISPVLYIESTDANTKTMKVKRFATWATRG